MGAGAAGLAYKHFSEGNPSAGIAGAVVSIFLIYRAAKTTLEDKNNQRNPEQLI